MKLGFCTSIESAARLASAGWDYVEESAVRLLEGLVPDEQWNGLQRARASALPILSTNILVPSSLKITGPEVDLNLLDTYMTRVIERAGEVGIRILVFGSAGARNVPDGFDRDEAFRQIVRFAQRSAAIAQSHDITLVVEPLGRRECNIINTLPEAIHLVRAVNHPHFQCLIDTYHFWLEHEPLEHLADAVQHIRHVHVADKVGRTAPGLSGQSDYLPLFRILKRAGYDGLVSVECADRDLPDAGALEFLKSHWQQA